MNFQNVQFEASYGLFQQIPPCEMPEFAFSGRSNVGKSSLINKLFNRKQLARVSAMPGKTTTINFFRVDNVRFADLPGYGYAKVSKKEKKRWSGLIGDYLASDRDIALVFQLIDMRHPPTKDDLLMIDYLVEYEMPFAVVLTKMDKLSQRERAERLASLQTEIPYADQITILPVSAQTGEGIEEIRQIIEELACRENETALGVESDLETDTVPGTIFAQPGQEDDVEEAIRRFRESVRSGELENKQQEKLPTRQRKRDETCL
ncbi:MAG: ribosome biogenesis GTP-binding protein YihA/YsxC [Oscillospiraceae bacterium]